MQMGEGLTLNHVNVLKREKQYRRLFWAGLVNGIGDRFSQVAVLSLLLTLTGSGLAVGVTFALRLLPYLVFGPLGGMLADRFSKKKIMILTDAVRIFFALSPLLVKDSSDIWIIYLSSFLLSAGEAFYAPARMSAIPRLVRKENLLSVNGLEEAMVGFVLIGGSVTGGVISAIVGVQITFVLNAISFLLSALLLAKLAIAGQSAPVTVKSQDSVADANEKNAKAPLSHDNSAEVSRTHGKRAEAPQSRENKNYALQTRENSSKAPQSRGKSLAEFRQILSGSAFLRMMIVVFAIWPIGDGIFNILISVYAVEVFHMGEIGIGMFYGALGIGLVAGSGLTGKVSRHMKAAAIFSLLLEGIINMLISQSHSIILAVLLFILTSACAGIGNACNRTILMNVVPAHLQGRFFGMLATLQNTIMGTSMFATGFLLVGVLPRTLGFAAGIFFTLLGAGFALIFYRSRQYFAENVQEEMVQ
jgi:MFS family permease